MTDEPDPFPEIERMLDKAFAAAIAEEAYMEQIDNAVNALKREAKDPFNDVLTLCDDLAEAARAQDTAPAPR